MITIHLFTSEHGLVNYLQGKKMYAYKDKSDTNSFHISVPFDQVEHFDTTGEFVIKSRGYTADMDVSSGTR